MARAAARAGALFTLSTVSTKSLEDVAAAADSIAPTPRWFQLYVYKDRSKTVELLRRAVASGYTAVVLTADTPVLGRREADIHNRFTLPAHLRLGNFSDSTSKDSRSGRNDSALSMYFTENIDSSLTWSDTIPFIRRHTPQGFRIIIKGVLSSEAAAEAVKQGVDGVWVSNHGGRQLDTVPATLEVLQDVCDAVKNVSRTKEVEVYMDGGIMRGTDIFKAIAMGARAVFVARAVMWGMVYNGEDGVLQVLSLLQEELRAAMILSGVHSIDQIDRSLIRHKSHWHGSLQRLLTQPRSKL